MTIPVEYGPIVAAGAFSAVAFLASWIGDLWFRREMEQLEQREQKERDERAKWQIPL